MSGELVAYVSEQGQSSLARAARVLGFGPPAGAVLPVDDGFRMRTDALEAAITADLAAGRRPLVVLAVAGTTNTGALDDLPKLARICGRYGVWLPVDGAYGAFAALTERGREALVGLELADSVTLDPHKWLYQPFECGALLVRRGHLLKDAFDIHPSYLQDTTARDGATNYAEPGLHATVLQRGRPIARLGRADCLGEIALMRSVPRTATAVAETRVRADRLDRDAFTKAVMGHRAVFEVAEEILRGHADRDAAREQPPATES